MKRILFGVLNWGLGHATRSIPYIEHFIAEGAEVYLASNGAAQQYLKTCFPTLTMLDLPGTPIVYGRKGAFPALLWQLPSLLNEHIQLRQWVKDQHLKYQFSGIVSDNVYALHHIEIPSVLICHQLQVFLPIKISFIQEIFNKYYANVLNRFQAIWIPEWNDQLPIAGALIENKNVKKYHFIGTKPLFESKKQPINRVVLLSGPEPQRTMLEQKILAQLNEATPSFTLIRGCEAPLNRTVPACCRVINVASRSQITDLLQSAAAVVARAGYSTLLETVPFAIPLALIPTPRQTEQEYLANYLQNLGLAKAYSQSDFDINECFKALSSFKPKNVYPAPKLLLAPLKAFIEAID